MKANEFDFAVSFVKKFGIGESREALNLARNGLRHVNYKNHAVLISDLNRLVESHELVDQFEDIKQVKTALSVAKDSFSRVKVFNRSDDVFVCYAGDLERAIADVESCQ